MAFVSETQRKVNQTSKTMCPLGPGQYFKDQQVKLRKDPAPFQSTSRRRTFLDINEKQKPGPGNYQISKPFIEPNIKTVSNSQSIIVKINSTGTAQFKSVVDRFQVRDHEVPGPGKYQNKQKIARSPKKKSLSQTSTRQNQMIEKLKQLTKKNYPAIPEKVRGLTDAKKEEVSEPGQLGPAFYNPNKNFSLNSTSTVWGKDKSRRFSLDSRSEVGPGKYNSQYNPIKPEDKVNQPSSHFKSSLVRTYWDSLFYKTNLNQTAKVRGQTNFKSKQPAPGQYEINSSSLKIQQKPFSFQFFGSTVERFPEKQVVENKKHKSFYNIKSQIGQNRSFNKSDHAFLCDQKRNPEFLKVVEKQKNPGPGYYRENVKVQKKLKGNKLQKFGTNSKRLFQVQDKADELGPGKYQKNSNQEDSIRNSRFGQVKDVSSNFRSNIGRDCFGTNGNEAYPFAQYDVSQYDLSKKMEKQKNFLQNLKKIDVEKAPFQSTISRFPHYQKKKDVQKNPAQESKEQELKIKQEADKVREMILEANKTQIQQTEKNNFGKTQRFKDQKKGAPSVGSYSLKASWQKKSHNIKYQHK